jgi:hypothetical protein
MYLFFYAGLAGIRLDRYGTGTTKNADAGTSQEPEKGTQSGTGMLGYRTERLDADAQLCRRAAIQSSLRTT